MDLLERPEPGCFTWHEWVHEKVERISEFGALSEGSVEKLALDLYEEFATGPRHLATLEMIFDLMKKKYPREMQEAFDKGASVRRKLERTI